MTLTDMGPQPGSFDLETATTENTNYRTVAWTGRYLQLTLMSVPVGESIGLEMHPDTDQFLRLDAGTGRAQMGPEKDNLTFEQDVSDGWCILVPAGTWHNVINTGDAPMRLYVIYAPVHHAAGNIHRTAADAAHDEEAGTDNPPAWAEQPTSADPDQHADNH
ncbi:cupin domain-containing protein [Paenarthrobacter sp. DKR-5]|uniref:cupin domain-containing protein n=1 Tax=Paenarthrobacter sp. DKR-5 TaxID=2835535 RepID=UPI001BDC4CB4|nr:cupin domain-containing protein [Paenarthrobacter sp. DKR-5]MBT1003876.1 cupin domain-containing protein [Paenarthrobacter sp. DKR-5]